MKALHIAATGMRAQELNVEVISNNVANMRTTGYKRQRADFQDLLYQNLRRMGTNSSANGTIVPTGVQIGSGVKTASTARIMSQGNLTQTGKELDVAVRGEGFFQIQMPDGGTAYTRDGSFERDPNGQLVTIDGYAILPGIVIPEDARDITISTDGQVQILDANNAVQQLGQIQTARNTGRGRLRRPDAEASGNGECRSSQRDLRPDRRPARL